MEEKASEHRSAQHSAIIIPAGEGQSRLRVFDDLFTFTLRSEQTDGAFTLIHDQVLPGGKVRMHIQNVGQETLLFLSGTIEFSVGVVAEDGQTRQVQTFSTTPGMVIHIPPGVPHGYRNNTTTIATFFVLFVPSGGTEHFFEQIGVPIDDPEHIPSFHLDPQKLLDVMKQFRVTYPPYAPHPKDEPPPRETGNLSGS